MAVAAVLSLLLAGTITHPVRRLRDEANDLLDRRGRLRGRFGGSRREDEIGDLARALEQLTHRLAGHQHTLEAFASDVSHELKNPLASIRSAAELLAELEDPADRERFAALAQREVARMERLLTGVREIGEIDARLEAEAPVRRGPRRPAAGGRGGLSSARRQSEVKLVLEASGGPIPVRAAPERLLQVFENLLDNAASFSPAGGTVDRHPGARATAWPSCASKTRVRASPPTTSTASSTASSPGAPKSPTPATATWASASPSPRRSWKATAVESQGRTGRREARGSRWCCRDFRKTAWQKLHGCFDVPQCFIFFVLGRVRSLPPPGVGVRDRDAWRHRPGRRQAPHPTQSQIEPPRFLYNEDAMNVPAHILEVISKLEEGLRDLYRERFRGLLLYGSYARGESREWSDVDLLLLLQGPVNVAREIVFQSELVSQLSLDSTLVLSVIPISLEDFEAASTIFLRTVRREAIPVAA